MRVVIVEDHPITRNVLSLALQAVPGYEVLSFSTAQEGLTACRAGADIAIFDNHLPDITGTAAVKILRGQPATQNLPVIMITGDGDRQTRMAAIDAGATDFLEKPVQIDELRIRVRNLLALQAAEKEARSGQALLETLIAAADARVAVADAQADGAPILYASDPVQQRISASAAGMRGLPLQQLWSHAPPSAEREALDQAVATATPGRFVLSDPLGDGDGWVEIALSSVAHAAGTPRYLVANLRSVTDLVESRQAHAQVASRLRDMAHLSSAWFFELDHGLALSYVSPALAQALDSDAEELVGRPMATLPLRLCGPDQGSVPASSLFAAPHRPVRNAMVTFELPNGDRRIVQMDACPVEGADGGFGGYRGHASDVSDIIRARDQAAQASRAKSVFLATMSHEMRTPLTAIMGLAELATMEPLPPGAQRHLADIRAEAQRLSVLLSDVLDVAAMDRGSPVLDDAPFDVAAVVRPFMEHARRSAEEKGLTFALEIVAPRITVRRGDAARFGAILRALVSNAIKFTPTGRVTVRLDLSEPSSMNLCVEDSGIGMDEAEQSAALLPFVQSDDGIARRFEGAGIGLSIVTWLTDAMEGEFRLTSMPGTGTIAKVSLPLPEEVADQPPRASAQEPGPFPASGRPDGANRDAPQGRPMPSDDPAAAPLRGLRILVADDNLANRKILATMLTRMGAEVTLCNDGAEAVEAWGATAFDILLLDINMPRMAGTEVMEIVRRKEAERGGAPVPALAVTANARPDQIALYRSVGFAGCLAKPFNRAQLRDSVQRCLEADRPGDQTHGAAPAPRFSIG
ncbi:MAG: response regulator [Alkalilacustris sp.]